MRNIVILHIFPDDKFFDDTADKFDSLSGVENRYYYYVSEFGHKFKSIKKTDRVKIINNIFAYTKELRRKDVDFVFFHSMTGRNYLFASILRKKAKIIWWGWGFDLYQWRSFLPPVIKIDIYKPLTKKFIETNIIRRKNTISYFFLYNTVGRLYAFLRRLAISRVSLFMPCIPIEYELLKKNCLYFHGDLAINPSSIPQIEKSYFEKAGNVLVGNSLTYTNNHLDVFESLYKTEICDGRKYIIPVSYGLDYGGADNLISASNFKKDTVIWLKDFMTLDDYNSLLKSVTHAIFGMVRQQGLGNIFSCLVSGVKVYLYKDSIAAKQLRRDGYVFYSIEDDLTTQSLSCCLSKTDSYHNYYTYINFIRERNLHAVKKQLLSLVD